MHKFEQVVDNEQVCVKMTTLLQVDPRISKMQMSLYKAALPKLSKDFVSKLVGFLKKQ